MAPTIHTRTTTPFLSKRNFATINIKNPLMDKGFIGTLIGCIVAGIVLLAIVLLILCLYREGHPFEKSRGKRRRRKAVIEEEEAETEESDTLELLSEPSKDGSSSKLSGVPSLPKPVVIIAEQKELPL
jgi:hypothetical protein